VVEGSRDYELATGADGPVLTGPAEILGRSWTLPKVAAHVKNSCGTRKIVAAYFLPTLTAISTRLSVPFKFTTSRTTITMMIEHPGQLGYYKMRYDFQSASFSLQVADRLGAYLSDNLGHNYRIHLDRDHHGSMGAAANAKSKFSY